MAGLPDDVAAALVRGIGTYIREIPPQEVPASLRRFRSYRPQTLTRHRVELLAALDDDAIRARIKHWLETEKPPLSKADARLLTIATTREGGWEGELQGAGKTRGGSKAPAAASEPNLDAEREKTRKAKDELKRAREELRSAEQRFTRRTAELESSIAELTSRLEAAEERAKAAKVEADRALESAERAQRKAKKSVADALEQRDAARKEAKSLRKELTAALSAAAPKKTPAAPRKRTVKPKERKPLPVPKGRLDDDPATLKKWLSRDDVRLVIDGYNVAKADGAYGDLELESQRERLVDALFKLAKMTGTETLVVFDAQKVPGRRVRRSKPPVAIEWSNEDQIADDYIIARLQELPQDPVVLVTNDKELQERGRELAATIATSTQLLALIR